MTHTLRQLVLLVLLVPAVACGGTNESPASESFDELGVSESESKPDIIRGKLKREDGALLIVEARGPEDHVATTLDLSRTEIAGSEDLLMQVADDQEHYVRGKIERREVGQLPNGTRIERDFLVAEVIGVIESRDTTATGVLRADDRGHMIEKRVGTGPDSDDAGSIRADFGEVSISLGALTGKKVRARGAKVLSYEGRVHGSLIGRQRIVVRTLARAR